MNKADPDLDTRCAVYVDMKDDYRVWARPYYDGNFMVKVTKNGKTLWEQPFKAKTNSGALSPGVDWVYELRKKITKKI